MEVKLRPITKPRINKVRKFPAESGLAFKRYGKSENIKDYSNREIAEMLVGVYKDTEHLLVDGDYFLDLNKVVSARCVLEDVSYYKKPTKEDYVTNSHNYIGNIRTFYIKDYYLITDEEVGGTKKHRITKYLYKTGSLGKGTRNFTGFYRRANSYGTILNGAYPKELFHPIKRYINGLFFSDDYKISSFTVESDLVIHSKG